MRRWGPVLRIVLAMVICVAVRGAVAGQIAASEVKVVTDQTGLDVSLKMGGVLEARLDANHTTGYSWVAAPVANPVLARQGAAKYDQHASGGKAGAGGVEVWRFKAMKVGKQELQFECRRPWEKSAPAAKTVTFTVTVE